MKTSILKVRKMMFIYFCRHNQNLMNEEFSIPRIHKIEKKQSNIVSKNSLTNSQVELRPNQFLIGNQFETKANLCA
jgi:hypothetical protein